MNNCSFQTLDRAELERETCSYCRGNFTDESAAAVLGHPEGSEGRHPLHWHCFIENFLRGEEPECPLCRRNITHIEGENVKELLPQLSAARNDRKIANEAKIVQNRIKKTMLSLLWMIKLGSISLACIGLLSRLKNNHYKINI